MRRGRRLRGHLERMGGPARRIGLQMAPRLDQQPPEAAAELAQISDHMEPFPVEHGLARLREICGGDMSTWFRSFDPHPVVSNTVSCVYQAELVTGERVAVKVRRPGIGQALLADIDAIGTHRGAEERAAGLRGRRHGGDPVERV